MENLWDNLIGSLETETGRDEGEQKNPLSMCSETFLQSSKKNGGS